MATTTRRREFVAAFCVDGILLDRLNELIRQSGAGAIRATAYMDDDTVVHELELAELKDLPNLRTRRIKRIVIETAYNAAMRITIDFDSRSMRAIEYSVTGAESEVISFSTRIEELIKSNFSRLSYFQKMPETHKPVWYLGIFACAFAIPQLPRILGHDGVPIAVSLLLFAIELCLIFFALFYSAISRLILPHEYFAIGDGLERRTEAFGRIKALKTTLFSVVILGIVVSVLANMFSKWLFE